MVGSSKKYVDPSKAVDILKEAFSQSAVGVGDAQQDVSEFQHKLLEWLEDAFKCHPSTSGHGSGGDNSEAGECSRRNPMVELFYGQYRAEGVNEGKGFSNDETFGQFPLQVNGFRDIHESLEAATAQGEIETVSTESTQKSGQELWFTRLPPVLTFELSRFQFNQQLGRPEKIHNKIEFPHIIYMDRYLGLNKAETRKRREQVKKLKEELVVLYAKLDKFNHYGSGSKKVPLQDVLSYALEFAHTKPDSSNVSVSSQDVEMTSPFKANVSTSSVDNMVTDSPSKAEVSSKISAATPPKCSRTTAMICDPAPRHIEETELKVLQQCLCRWRTEVEQDVRELQEKISSLEESVNGMYKDDLMQRCPYQLHAVLVHEGQAASGHYWAYIYDTERQEWLKFNDITVSSASWEDLVKESVGGYHNASAYCLMYVDKSHMDDQDSSSTTDMPQQCDLENLPDDLKVVVMEDNKKFNTEIEEWDRDQANKATAVSTQGCGSSGEGDGGSEMKASKVVSNCLGNWSLFPGPNRSTVSTQTGSSLKNQYPVIHAELSCKRTIEIVSDVVELETFQTKGAPAALKLACSAEFKRVEQIVKTLPHKLPREDPRLQHPVVYLIACNAQSKVIDRFLYEQFAYCPLLQNDERARKIQEAARSKLKQLLESPDGQKLDQSCQVYHERYHQFRRLVYYFVKGLQLFNDERYGDSLPYLVHAYSQNQTLALKIDVYGLQENLVCFYRRQCMLHINDMVAHQFENNDDITGALDIMNDMVLPCLTMLLNSGNQDDVCAAEEIREKWCAFLGHEIGEKKVEKLQDFLSKLFDPPTETKRTQIQSPSMSDLKDLYKTYLDVMDLAERSGYLERAYRSK
ncbi:hypothetical protein FSP39_020622 [Pinctada imbricata]|uniref:USP domain-containing protein n=1 Tax=Pinctada imbricata TaxID=66713 RepID=A0AA89C3P3_PINIB|nr:hypothetical protein FSP39_020622 [Pinctada imbricata]